MGAISTLSLTRTYSTRNPEWSRTFAKAPSETRARSASRAEHTPRIGMPRECQPVFHSERAAAGTD
jgi:hypothetical protein